MVQFYCGLHTVRAQIRSQTANFMRLCENDSDDNVYDESRAAAHHRMNWNERSVNIQNMEVVTSISIPCLIDHVHNHVSNANL